MRNFGSDPLSREKTDNIGKEKKMMAAQKETE